MDLVNIANWGLGVFLGLMTFLFIFRIVLTWYPQVELNRLPWKLIALPTEPLLIPVRRVIPPIAIAFIDSPLKPWLILISYIIINQVTDKVIIPKLRKNRVKLIPANVIVGEVFYANFLGLLGLFLALPLTIISQILIKEILIKDIFDHWQAKQ